MCSIHVHVLKIIKVFVGVKKGWATPRLVSGVQFKISDEHPRLFYMGAPRGRFATKIFSATQRCNIDATLFRIVTALFQHCSPVLC